MATLRAGTGLHPLADPLFDDVAPVGGRAGLAIDSIEHVLKDGLRVAEEPPGLPVQLPQDARLADREEHFLIADVDQDALEHLVEVERFGRYVLVVPRERPFVWSERQGGAGVERRVGILHAAA